MITAEAIYEKAKMLDAYTLQEVADFLDFVVSKHDWRKLQEQKRQFFPVTEIESLDQKPSYSTKVLSIEDMDAAIEYEASRQHDND
jgi:hypothetical protein